MQIHEDSHPLYHLVTPKGFIYTISASFDAGLLKFNRRGGFFLLQSHLNRVSFRHHGEIPHLPGAGDALPTFWWR